MWPEGLLDAPQSLVTAYNEALQVLSWYEHLQKDEVPPRHIWWSGELLDEWFEEVQERRKQSPSKRRSAYDAADDSPMMGNELVNRDLVRPGADGGREVPL